MYFPRSIQLKNVKCGSHDRPETIACKTFSFSFYIERMFYVLHGCTLGFLYYKTNPNYASRGLYGSRI